LAISPQKCPHILDVKICRSNLWEEFDDISPLKIRLPSNFGCKDLQIQFMGGV
jgi:hypothetical protein